MLTIDYRGFGDSSETGVTEGSLLEDAMAGLSWLREKGGADLHILVLGHSLGTAVAARAVAEQSCQVSGLILMAPFNNLLDEVISKCEGTSSRLKYWLWCVVSALSGKAVLRYLLSKLQVEFRTDEHLASVNTPLLVLHAEDDDKIPVELARKLVLYLTSLGKTNVRLHVYDESHGYKHDDIFKAQDLPSLILEFTS